MTIKVMNPVSLSRLGVDITQAALSAMAATDTAVQFRNTGQQSLVFLNTSGASVNVTPNLLRTVESQAPTALPALVVPTGKTWLIGPFNMADFNDVNGNMSILIPGAVTLFVAVVQLIPIPPGQPFN